MGSNCLRENKAFSLLELVISVAILSVGITVVLQAFSFSARAGGLSCDIINALFLAEDKIQELEFKEKQNLIGAEPAQVNGKNSKFDWVYTLNFDPELNLYKLNLDVTWQRLSRKEAINLDTYLRE